MLAASYAGITRFLAGYTLTQENSSFHIAVTSKHICLLILWRSHSHVRSVEQICQGVGTLPGMSALILGRTIPMSGVWNRVFKEYLLEQT